MSHLRYVLFIQLLCWPLALAAQTSGAQSLTATISGQVRLNGEPQRGVAVVLRPERMTVPPGPQSVHQAQSDERGNYRITGIVAGAYNLSLLDPELVIVGGIATGLRGKLLNLTAGEQLEDADLELKRGGVITGRVTDTEGRPLRREQIELIKFKEDGQPQTSAFNHPMSKLTDEEGGYRISGLPEGRYLIAVGMAQQESKPFVNYSAYPKTYHPGVADPAQARAIAVSPEAETTNVDIVVPARRTYEIHGRVVAAETGQPVGGIEILYRPIRGEERVNIGWRPAQERSKADGEFHIGGLPPGKYALYARAVGEAETVSEPVVCEIATSALEGINLSLSRGASLSGVVVLEGTESPAVLAKLAQNHIYANSKAKSALTPPKEPTKLREDGSFLIQGVPPGKVHLALVINPALGGFWVRRVERNGVAQPDGIEVGANEKVSNLRVVVGYSNLALRGEVKVIGGKLPPHYGIYVNANRVDGTPPKTIGANVDTRGQFRLENLLPGEYELRLVSLIYQPGEPRDPQLSKLIASIRQKVTVGKEQPIITLVIDLSQRNNQ